MIWTIELSERLKQKLANENISISQATKQTGLNYRTFRKLLEEPGVSVYKRVYEIAVYWLLGIDYIEEEVT